MSELLGQIKQDMITAMKAKEADKLKIIRSITAAVKQVEIDSQKTLDDAGVLGVINKMIKQRRDSIEQFIQGGREDLANIEKAEIAIIEKYLPEQLSESEVLAHVEAAIKDTGAAAMQDMGKVMGILKAKLTGKADMGAVSKFVKDKLA